MVEKFMIVNQLSSQSVGLTPLKYSFHLHLPINGDL
jgi:hypothetical protein